MPSFARSVALAGRAVGNLLTDRPLVVSLEITHRCNARCKHCHRGVPVPGEIQAPPEVFAERCREIRPLLAQISGGEPMLRADVVQIAEAVKNLEFPPYLVLITNGSRLTRERYDRLRAAGVDTFSISLDYPDERHDTFRQIPGLFSRIESLAESLADVREPPITLSAVVQRENFRDLVGLAELARKWGVRMNYSPYTWMRTQDKATFLPQSDELHEIADVFDQLRAHKRAYRTVITSDYAFDAMLSFFGTHRVPGCRAGERFLIVNPDGTLSPCGLLVRDYTTLDGLVEGFTRHNTCENCYTSTRINTEKPVYYQFRDAIRSL